MVNQHEPARLAAALGYERLGWSVLPLCPHNHVAVGKAHRGCQSPGKRPFFPNKAEGAQGEWKEFQTRRATADEIAAQHAAHPDLNVGMALGPVSGLVAVDVDDDDGDRLLHDLAGGELPPTLEYSTGKGRRLLFRLPPGVSVLNHQFRRPGTEIEILRFMSAGGQVVLPPSKHPNGATYRWKPGHAPGEIEPADVPEWMRAAKVPAGAERVRPADGELIGEGGRNNYLTSLAGAMRKHGADEEVIFAALDKVNETRFDPPLAESEVRTVARSVSRYEPDEFSGVTFKVPDPEAVRNMPAVDASGRKFKWFSELAKKESAEEWVWEGYLPKGAIALLSALWKAGKTTLLSHIVKALEKDGEFLGQRVRAAKILYVSEEAEHHWAKRRDVLHIGDHAAIYLQPFGTKPDWASWRAFVAQLAGDVKAHKFDLVVFDTLAKLWPVTEENDAGSVDAALMPLWDLTKLGAGVLLVHHLRKSGGTEYTGSRGSGALSAFPDVIIELTRFDASSSKSCKRVLKAIGRYEEIPDEITIELIDGEYRRLGDQASAAAASSVVVDGNGAVTMVVPCQKSDEEKVLHVLSETKGTPWMRPDAVRIGLQSFNWGMRSERVTDILVSLCTPDGPLTSTGTARSKTNPLRYALKTRVLSRSASHSHEHSQGRKDGNEMSGDVGSSHSQFSTPGSVAGNEIGNEIESKPHWWPELLLVLEVNGPMTDDRLYDLTGYEPGGIAAALAKYAADGVVSQDGDGLWHLLKRRS